MPNLVLKKSSKSRQGFTAGTEIVTKQFDLGDPTMFKKYSQCSVTYQLKGNGISPIKVTYKIDNESIWQNFQNEPNNEYGIYGHLKKTNNKAKTAQFKFQPRSRGRKLTLRFYYNNQNGTIDVSNVANDFKLIDVSYTFRSLKRD